jgi:hypothetical protein
VGLLATPAPTVATASTQAVPAGVVPPALNTPAREANNTTEGGALSVPYGVAAAPSLPINSEPLLSERYRPQPGDSLTILKPGVLHLRRVTADPLRINVLVFDLNAPEFGLKVGLREGWLSGRARTSALAREYDAFAAVNGDLFSENGLPQGLTIVEGRTAIAPKRRATFAISKTGEPFIGYFTEEWTWQAEVRTARGTRFPITLLNQPCVQGQICLYNDFSGSIAARSGAITVRLDPGGRVTEVVEGTRMRLRPHERALLGTGAGARWLAAHAREDTRLTVLIGTEPALNEYEHAISGGPIILREGTFVQDCLCALGDCSQTARPAAQLRCEDFSTDWKLKHYLDVRMPRTGIGFDEDRRRLIVAVVDGYQRGYSRGITQQEFADLLFEFGASEAMELDGGGSSTMVLNNKVINSPPDQSGERYVANALLFFWNEEDAPLPSRRQ